MDVTWKMICVVVMVGQARDQFCVGAGCWEISNFKEENKIGPCESLIGLPNLCQWGEFLLVKRD